MYDVRVSRVSNREFDNLSKIIAFLRTRALRVALCAGLTELRRHADAYRGLDAGAAFEPKVSK